MTQRTEIENENSNEYMGGWLNNNEIEPTSQYEVDDEAEKMEIKSRISKMQIEIHTHKEEIYKMQAAIMEKKSLQKELTREKRELSQSHELKEQYDEVIESIKSLQKIRRNKIAEHKTIRMQLGGKKVDNADFLSILEADIRALHKKQASGEVRTLSEEKKVLSEIARHTKYKKMYKYYLELGNVINQYDVQLTMMLEELIKIRQIREEISAERKSIIDQISANASEIETSIARRRNLLEIIAELRSNVNSCYAELHEYII